MPPDRGLADRVLSGLKSQKTRITYTLTANADGSHKLPPFIIGRWNKPRPFGGKTGEQLGFKYRNNKKAWMTATLYQEWLLNWDAQLTAQDPERKILLLQDNCTAHIPPDGLRSIIVENLEPNLTAHVQPNDQGIIRCFKAHYRARFTHRSIDRYNSGVPIADIYAINQLEAMRIADEAWRDVNADTIRHCWRKAGILPDNLDPRSPTPSIPIESLPTAPLDPISHAEATLTTAIDSLVDTGMLRHLDRMDLNEILDPVEESAAAEVWTDEEIFQAVLEGDEDSEDASQAEPILPQPTRQEVFSAVEVLRRFTVSMDDVDARRLESALGSFTRMLRVSSQAEMVSSKITDYFPPP